MAICKQSEENIKIKNYTYEEQRVMQLIVNNESEDYEHLLQQEENLFVLRQLSRLSTGIIQWYDFDEKAKVLEIGAGFGALTGVLCDKCAKVVALEENPYQCKGLQIRYENRDNLSIITGGIEQLEENDCFDYILLVGVLETLFQGSEEKGKYVEYLKQLKKYSHSETIIFLAIDNRMGLKNFCGERDLYTNRIFDGLNNYPHGTIGRGFTGKEILEVIKKAGYEDVKGYYPLPDYKFTQLVYSDECLPTTNLHERLIPYYDDTDTIVIREKQLYKDIIENGAFEAMANSFLFLISAKKMLPWEVIYAAISIDRGKERGFATTIYHHQEVRKKPLYIEADLQVNHMMEAMHQLKHFHMPVLEMKIENRQIVMDYMKAPTLSNYLRDIVEHDVTKVVAIFDQLWDLIQQSSTQVAAEKNQLLEKSYMQKFIQDKNIDLQNLDFGPILEHAYIELIPLNSFYQEEKIVFFDQEFMCVNYPAKYIMFRAIHYFYVFAPFASRTLPSHLLKERYGLEQLWDIFLCEEMHFLREVRNHELYYGFYQKTVLDPRKMKEQVEHLGVKKEELLSLPKIELQLLQKLQQIQYEILTIVDQICREENIQYFAFFGTLLGAIRHQGMIPWDDDIDIALERGEYERFLVAMKEKLPPKYTLQTPQSDPNCFTGGYARIRNNETTALELLNWHQNCNQGIWIDIFPLDKCYEDEKKRKKQRKKVTTIQAMLFTKIYRIKDLLRYKGNVKKMSYPKWLYYQMKSWFKSKEKLYMELEKAMQSCNDTNSPYVASFGQYINFGEGLVLDKDDVKEVVYKRFEQLKLPCPKGSDRCLALSEGTGYLSYPRKESRVPKSKAFIATNVPYFAYKKRFREGFKALDGEEKVIVLFGAGDMFKDYMKKHRKYKPDFLVDNDQRKWGTVKDGFEIKSPQSLLEIPKEKLHLIICNIYFREIEMQIRKMGILDYYIYVENKEWLTRPPVREIVEIKKG